MDNLALRTKQISGLLPKIAINLRVARLIDEIKPGLTTSQLMVLLTLKEKKDIAIPVGNLAEQLSVSFPAVSGIVDRLVKEKLIKRRRSGEDRRLVLIELTNTGKKMVGKLSRAFERLLFDVLKKIPEVERETIIKAIERVFEFSIALSEDAHGKEVSLPETTN